MYIRVDSKKEGLHLITINVDNIKTITCWYDKSMKEHVYDIYIEDGLLITIRYDIPVDYYDKVLNMSSIEKFFRKLFGLNIINIP